MRKVLHILGYFTEEDIAWITQVGSRKSIAKQEILIKSKTPQRSLFLVLSGRFLIHRSDGATIAKVQSGEILGEMSFVEDEVPNVDVTSLEDSSVIVIDYEYISERFREVQGFECRFYKAISHFLSARLRFLTAKPTSLENGKLVLDQLDANIDKATLERLNIAGERFNRLLNHFG